MNRDLVIELMKKDLQDIRQNRYVIYSLLFLPILLAAMGIIGTVTITLTGAAGQASQAGVDITTIFSSLFVLIPAIISTLVASTSVVLEKNNRSLEPLLATPITDSEFFAGKALAPFIPGVLIAWLAYGIYIGATDALTYGYLGYFMFPTMLSIIQLFFLIPVVGFLGTFAALLVSSKTKDVRSAQNLSGLVVLPVMLLVYAPLFAAGHDILINMVLGIGVLAAGIALYFVSVKVFNRESILVSWGR